MKKSQYKEYYEKDIQQSLPFEIIELSKKKKKGKVENKLENCQNQSKVFKRSISADKNQSKDLHFKDQKSQISKDDQPLTEREQFEYKLIQVEISDFVIIEKCKSGKEFQLLKEKDWKKIITQKSLKGFNLLDIHVSLLTQDLFFQERRELWQFFCQTEQIKIKIQQTNQSFVQYSKKDNNFCQQIDKDIQRTQIGSLFLSNQDNMQSLRKILMAYANYDPELGYTQGMNIIVANLLICYDLQSNDNQFLQDVEIYDPFRDEIVFYIFIYIMIELNWRSTFLPGFPGLIRLMKVLESRFIAELPQLYQHFKDVGVDFNICFQYQYLTLLMYGISWKISRMIFDVFLFEGEEIIHTFIIGMLKYCQDFLLKLYTFEEILKFCKNDMIIQFYSLFTIHLNGKKDLTNTLLNLGFIKQNERITDLNLKESNHKTKIQQQNNFGQINKIGTYLKQYFRKT